MKKDMLCGLGILLAAAAFADPSVTVTGATAHSPWDGLVDVGYTVSGLDGAETAWQLALTFGSATAVTFEEAAWCDLPVANGAHTVTWNARADGIETPDLTAPAGAFGAVTATRANADYMIVDVSSGKDSAAYPVRYATAPNGVTSAAFNKPAYKLHKIVFKRVKVGDFLMTDGGDPYTFKMGVGQVATGTAWHPVRLTKDYFLGIFEVTQQQYQDVTGTNPSSLKTKETALDSIKAEITDYTMHPAEQLVYDTLAGADGLFTRLTSRTGMTVGAPTEAQWEFACRAGCENMYHWGADALTTEGEYVEDKYGWHNWNNDPNGGVSRTHHGVGEKLPNAWGFYDMTGNVYEYCSDWYAAYTSTSASAPEEDPAGAATGTLRPIRGGAAAFQMKWMASGARQGQSTSSAGTGYGGLYAPFMGERLAVTVE